MARPVSGKIMEDLVWVKISENKFYCYHRQRLWRDGQCVTLGKKLLGKSTEKGGELVPTRAKRPSKKTTEQSEAQNNPFLDSNKAVTATRKHTGMMDIIEHVGDISGIDEDLYLVTDKPTAEKILSIARYIVATDGASLPGIEEWMLTHSVPYQHPITEDVYRKLFNEVGRDESLRQGYFKRRFDREEDLALVIAYDSSTQNSETRNPEARVGMNKEHNGKRAIKILVLYSLTTRQPLAFSKQPANVPDVISLENAINQLKAFGVKRVVMVTDGGFSSEENLAMLLHSSNHSLTRVKLNWRWVNKELLEHRKELASVARIMPSDVCVKGTTVSVKKTFKYKRTYGSTKKNLSPGDEDTFEKKIYLHFYSDSAQKEKEDREFFCEIMELKKLLEEGSELSEAAQKAAETYLHIKRWGHKVTTTLNESAIEEACQNHGVFALVSDYYKTADEALTAYRKREWIESYFEKFKQQTDGSTSRTGNPENLMGRLFVQFIAMGYIEKFYTQIRQMKENLGVPNGDPKHDTKENLEAEKSLRRWLEERSLPRILKWFDAYETTEVSREITSRRWSTEVILRDKMFLKRLGMSPI